METTDKILGGLLTAIVTYLLSMINPFLNEIMNMEIEVWGETTTIWMMISVIIFLASLFTLCYKFAAGTISSGEFKDQTRQLLLDLRDGKSRQVGLLNIHSAMREKMPCGTMVENGSVKPMNVTHLQNHRIRFRICMLIGIVGMVGYIAVQWLF
jgi:Na+/phosphate symporter